MLNSPDRSNTAALVTTYYPDAGTANRVVSLARILDAVLVLDNTGEDGSGSSLEQTLKASCVEFIRQPTNVGVAAALNKAADWARAKGWSWLLTMDQDSEPLPGLIESAGRAWRASPSNQMIGAIGTAAISETINSQAEFVPTTSVITSGTLINLEAWKKVGGFRDDFFIDAVDEEFCLRLQRNGYKVIQATQPGISHVIGRPSNHRLFARTVYTSNHSPARRYYMARNRIRLAFEYFSEQPRWISQYLFYSLKDFCRMLLFEKQRLKKFVATLLGIVDGLRGKMGALQNGWLNEG